MIYIYNLDMKIKIRNIREFIANIVDVNRIGFKASSAIYLLLILTLVVLTLIPFGVPETTNTFIKWLGDNQSVFLWIFVADFILKFITVDIRQPKIFKKLGYKIYILPTSWWTLVDGIVFLAWIPGLQWMIIMKALTLLKVIKFFPRVNNAVSFMVHGLLREKRAIAVILMMLSLIIVVGGFMFFSMEYTENENIHTIWDALWFSFISATTIGYGDITPVTSGGRIIAMIFSIVGIINVALLTGVSIYGIQTEARSQRLKIRDDEYAKNDATLKTLEYNFWLTNKIDDELTKELDKKEPAKKATKKKDKVSSLTSKI